MQINPVFRSSDFSARAIAYISPYNNNYNEIDEFHMPTFIAAGIHYI